MSVADAPKRNEVGELTLYVGRKQFASLALESMKKVMAAEMEHA
jgi:hypothetical protein